MAGGEVFLTTADPGATCDGCRVKWAFRPNRDEPRPAPLSGGETVLYYSDNYRFANNTILCCQRCDPARIATEQAKEKA